ncbi:pyridoxal-dependent decarboxylase [Brevibacillus ruminantium]|uniref:Pyridoxal-dependent decarboxylase n=1 Tax=Brevibacillus ruminantium TaxID=2950604 RepID=A0ABY4WFK8_9BACL|nr:pyridoxal-dependent decarboxylase [Brevibacillus ruminantium]USG64600.1 pyridoxal-dependent decarboxylase [Brevibacillus ruminantium]
MPTNFMEDHLNRFFSEYYPRTHHLQYNQNLLAELDREAFQQKFEEFCQRISKSVDFASPRYLAHQVSVPTDVGLLGFFIASLYNQNQHAYEASPVTTEMELESIRELLDLFEFPEEGWGHFTSCGTVANLEAAWLHRKKHKNKFRLLFPSTAHISWGRIADIINADFRIIGVNEKFQMDLENLEAELKKARDEQINVLLVANLGATGCGAVDPIHELVPLKRTYDFSLHVDAAWGGYLKVLINTGLLSDHFVNSLGALYHADSITVDPHKQGLLPYGCGAVLYRDAQLKKEIVHQAPYTFILGNNLGQISLEGSRNGAYAAASWLNTQLYPLSEQGLGKLLKAMIRQTRQLKEEIERSGFKVLVEPEMNILCFYPDLSTLSRINDLTEKLIERCSISNGARYPIFSKFVIDDLKYLEQMPCVVDDSKLVAIRCVVSKYYRDWEEWRKISSSMADSMDSLMAEFA